MFTHVYTIVKRMDRPALRIPTWSSVTSWTKQKLWGQACGPADNPPDVVTVQDLSPLRDRWHLPYSSNVTDTTNLEVTGTAAVEPLVVLQAVADPVRWSVLAMLAEAPRCVCKLREQIPIAGNLLSYHLKVLREAGLVTTSRRGRWVDYALAPGAPERMRAALPGASVAVSA